MHYEASSPKEYLDQLEPDWRKDKLLEVRNLIMETSPVIKEGMEYKMLAYRYGDKNIFHLNAQKDYIGLYVGSIDKVDYARELLKDFSMGKGCIRVKKSVDLSKTNLREFLKRTVAVWDEGGETEC